MYRSTSCEARGALLEMHSLDPDFYAEIMLGRLIPPGNCEELGVQDSDDELHDYDSSFNIAMRDFGL